MEESKEFADRLANGGKLPLFTSCCPAWIKYAENEYPEILPNISTCRSPMQMFASVINEKFKGEGKKILSVAVMPCTAKRAKPQEMSSRTRTANRWLILSSQLRSLS